VGLNEILQLNIALTHLKGLYKMNDVLAVEVFSVDNLTTLKNQGKLFEAYYLLPFVCWYSAITIQGLGWEARLELLKMAFHIFALWYQQSKNPPRGYMKGHKFFVERPDLKRYLNTTLFLYFITSKRKPIAYNRIGTHPVENLFGLVRVSSHFDHTWPKFLMAIARGS
jgi:hypothetical protein